VLQSPRFCIRVFDAFRVPYEAFLMAIFVGASSGGLLPVS
jgi:di/tricarboxylate transporter